MNKKFAAVITCVIAIGILSGCATRRVDTTATAPTPKAPEKAWSFESVRAIAETADFVAKIEPSGSYGYESFVLAVVNKSKKNIEINWNKTLYVANNQTSGGFMFEGVVYRERNSPKQPDVVFAGGNLVKTIWPNALVEFESGKYGGWRNRNMWEGEHGIYLTLSIDGKEVNERLSVKLVRK